MVFVIAVGVVKSTSEVILTPSSGEPSDMVIIEGTDFAVSTSVGVGFGHEVEVINEPVTVTSPEVNTFVGYTANQPIKPGSFKWSFSVGGVPFVMSDFGNGTLYGYAGYTSSSEINYTSGFFRDTLSSASETQYTNNKVNYTTYAFDVTPEGLCTNSSGILSGEIEVPEIWNETHAVTVVDEKGNMATTDFTVFGSDIVPDPLTIGAIVVLSSTAMLVSFYWLRKGSLIKKHNPVPLLFLSLISFFAKQSSEN